MAISRRNLVVSAISGSILLLSPVQQTFAFWPLLLRFVVGGAIRSTASRAVVSTAARAAAGTAARRGAAGAIVRRESMKRVASLKVSAGLVASVSPTVYALAEEHNAEAIWVQQGYDNEFEAVLGNDSHDPVASQLYVGIEDVPTGSIEREKHCGLLSAGPSDTFRFSFNIADLPYPGVKRITGRTTDPAIKCLPSGAIIVASQDDVSTQYE